MPSLEDEEEEFSEIGSFSEFTNTNTNNNEQKLKNMANEVRNHPIFQHTYDPLIGPYLNALKVELETEAYL